MTLREANMLSAKNISKEHAGRNVLRSVDLEIMPGTITSLIGPSGAGKSTLLYALSFVDPPDSGSIRADDVLYSFPGGGNPFPTRSAVLVFQQLFLWPHLTLRENIALSGRADDREVSELIAAFGMESFVDRYPNQTSLGQRQRAALARAIAVKPRYLLLDEVTSALDIEQIEVLSDYLEKLRKEGTTILIVTHLIHFAQRISDQVLFMDKGEIVEAGGEEMISNPKQQRTKDFLQYF